MLGEPPPTQADLHFRVLSFPVRVHPFFWIVAVLLVVGGGPIEPLRAVVWVVVVFASVLVHELGHAVVQRRCGGHPRITLYALGGLTSSSSYDQTTRNEIAVSLAGPLAGFLLATLAMLTVQIAGHQIGLAASPQAVAADRVIWLGMPLFGAYFEPFASPPMNYLVADLIWINVLWGLVNLLPIYPLDGGQVARELFTLGHPRRGIITSLWLSIVVAVGMAIWGLSQESLFVPFLFGYLAYFNYQTIRAYQQHWR